GRARVVALVLCLGPWAARCTRSKGTGPTPTGPAEAPETAVRLETNDGPLYGTLDLPAGPGPFPVVVIISGSGPTDRDGNQPLMRNDSLKLLGRGLAARGIAVLRYDKRGIGQSAAAARREEDIRFDA